MAGFVIYFAITTQDGELALVSLFPSILVIVAIVLGCKYHLCISITVNYNLQTVVIKIIKLLRVCGLRGCLYLLRRILRYRRVLSVLVRVLHHVRVIIGCGIILIVCHNQSILSVPNKLY